MREPICKFNDSKANAINCTQFIYETTDIQRHPIHAVCHHVGLVKHGHGLLTVNSTSRSVAEGDIYFIKKGSTFSISPDVGMEYYYISFHGWHADELIERLGITREHFVYHGQREITAFWLACFSQSEDKNLDLFSEAVLLYTAAQLADSPKETDDLAVRIFTHINEHFSDPELSLRGIADNFGYDSKYLSALIKEKRGITFTQYLRGIRIKHAAFLFEEGIESVKSAAVLSGFPDPLYFSRIFKQETGMSPSAYCAQIKRSPVP